MEDEAVSASRRDGPAHVLIAGGGVAALEATLALRALAEERIEVELLAPEPLFWYRPLAVAEPFQLGAVRHFELSELAAAAGAIFSPGALASVDAGRRLAYTAAGAVIPYDALLLACGAVPGPAVPGALTFRGPADTEKIEHLLAELEQGDVRRLVFAVPSGAVWALPIYELALMTAAWLAARSVAGVELALVTPEEEPLSIFGRNASDSVRQLLDESGVAVHCALRPAEFRDGELLLAPDGAILADRVVALPRLHGQRLDGIPQTVDGFVPVDPYGRVVGVSGLYAAGDVTSFPVKQGGIAAQQAESAAHAIAVEAGADVKPLRFRPVLRGFLLTGTEPRYLRHELQTGVGTVSPDPLWWPPAKIVGRYLAPFLAAFVGVETGHELLPRPGMVPVHVELAGRASETAERLDASLAAAEEHLRSESDGATVGDIMLADYLAVGADDTLGDVAARMREHEVGSALVVEEERLIGILTSRDLLRAFAGRVHPGEARVRHWMTAEPVAVSPTTTLGVAVLLMTERNIHHLPVVEGERPLGMLGLRDAIRSAEPRSGIGLGF
ncbi:MAG: CBS domain-containing protein [Gaiellaceae bacterium]